MAVLSYPRGHKLMLASFGGLPLVFCSRCGSYGTDYYRNLADNCRAPGPGGRTQLERLRAGRHPVQTNLFITGVWDLATAKAMRSAKAEVD